MLTWAPLKRASMFIPLFIHHNKLQIIITNLTSARDAAVKEQFDANVFAMLRVIRAFLPQMRDQGHGLIMNLSSVGGFSSFATNGIYCATKFAVEGITQALASEYEAIWKSTDFKE